MFCTLLLHETRIFIVSITRFRHNFARLIAPLLVFATSLTGCTSFSTTSLPSFGFGSSTSQSPDCTEIEKRMRFAHKQYASALGHEKPAIYLTFTGNLSRTMKKNHLAGIYQMTDLHLDHVVDRTQQSCFMGNLGRSVCAGANRLGRAYKPLVLAAREAHENYCGNRPIQ